MFLDEQGTTRKEREVSSQKASKEKTQRQAEHNMRQDGKMRLVNEIASSD